MKGKESKKEVVVMKREEGEDSRQAREDRERKRAGRNEAGDGTLDGRERDWLEKKTLSEMVDEGAEKEEGEGRMGSGVGNDAGKVAQ